MTWYISGLIALLALSLTATANDRIEAVASIVTGMELSNNASHDLTHELDGTVVELGTSSCVIKAGHCTLEKIKPGAHIASAIPKNTSRTYTDTFIGTNTGSVVRITSTDAGELTVFPQKVSKLVYKIRRTKGSALARDDDEDEEDDDTNPSDQSLKVDLWVRYFDERDGSAHERPAFESELTGGKLRLGHSTCIINSNVCVFNNVRVGINKVRLTMANTDKFSFKLDPDTHPFTIYLNEWTHKPNVKEFNRDPYILVEKSRKDLTLPPLDSK